MAAKTYLEELAANVDAIRAELIAATRTAVETIDAPEELRAHAKKLGDDLALAQRVYEGELIARARLIVRNGGDR